MKKPEDALNAERMNVKDGGKQPFMRDTMWNGANQRMVTDDGLQKGMKTVLEERGVDTRGMNADKLRRQFEVNLKNRLIHVTGYHVYSTLLLLLQDFQDRTTLLQQEVTGRGHICLYLPKFHCELNPIERVWCHAKKHTRAYCNGSIVRLRKIVPESLAGILRDISLQSFRTMRGRTEMVTRVQQWILWSRHTSLTEE